MNIRPFSPAAGTNQKISVTSTSQSVTVERVSKSVRIVNDGSKTAFVRMGLDGQVATTADTPVLGGQSLILFKGEDVETIAVISESPNSTTLYVQLGSGGI